MTNPTLREEFELALIKWKAEAGEIPEATCADIDKAINKIDSAMGLLESAYKRRNNCSKCDQCNNRCETEDVAEHADDAHSELSYLEDILEKLRKENQQLRSLGEYWYEKCKDLIGDLDK